MEDLFYFSKNKLDLMSIAEIAEAVGYKHQFFSHVENSSLNIYYDNHQFWQWMELGGDDFDGFEQEQREQIDTFQPTSAFLISYHINSLTVLLALLRIVLDRYDGWIGCDDGRFESIYNRENIENLRHPCF